MTSLSLSFILLVGIAGALGAVSRYLLGRFVAERVSAQFPLGTLIINLTGAFLIGCSLHSRDIKLSVQVSKLFLRLAFSAAIQHSAQ